MALTFGLFFFAGLGMTLGVLLVGLLSLLVGGMVRRPMQYLAEGVVAGAVAGSALGLVGFVVYVAIGS